MSEKTKREMAIALERCLRYKAMDQLKVADIAKESGYTRQTFYNYFQDMYDFVFWVHTYFDEEALQHFYTYKSFYQCLCKSLESMKKHTTFYRELIKTEGPNSFFESFNKLTIQRCYEVFAVEISEEEKFMLQLYWDGATRRICKWIENGMQQSCEWIAQCLYDSMPEKIKRFYKG